MNQNLYHHWSETKYLKDIVTNPLIEVGDYSYFLGYYDHQSFEDSCVRYHWGDDHSRALFDPQAEFGWQLDRLIIGRYVCIASGVVILMGGNHNHHPDWISAYPFPEQIATSYEPKGNTIIEDGAWIGMRAMIMPGVHIGQGAIIAAGAVVVKYVPAYTIVGGNPAHVLKQRFTESEVELLQALDWYQWPIEKVQAAQSILASHSVAALKQFDQIYQ